VSRFDNIIKGRRRHGLIYSGKMEYKYDVPHHIPHSPGPSTVILPKLTHLQLVSWAKKEASTRPPIFSAPGRTVKLYIFLQSGQTALVSGWVVRGLDRNCESVSFFRRLILAVMPGLAGERASWTAASCYFVLLWI